jgi:adenosylhomocysteinase
VPDALAAADLVVSATGSRAIGIEHLALLRQGAVLAGATSSDDEFDLGDVHDPAIGFAREAVIPGVVRYSRDGRSFVLLGNGNAVNFLHTSALGPAIHLIKAEIIAAIARLTAERHDPGLYEVPDPIRARIAATWVDTFRPASNAHTAGAQDARNGGRQ